MKYQKYVFALIILVGILTFISVHMPESEVSSLVMGASLFSEPHDETEEGTALPVPDQEKYFRPSKLPILNNRIFDHDILFQPGHDGPMDPLKITVNPDFLTSPENTILNYFSILRSAENLTKDKYAGCGTVGDSKYPFPIAYNFYTKEYQKKVSFKQFLDSFQGIGHTNLIKLKKLPADVLHPNAMRYIIELETIEGSDKGVAHFVYYYGYVYISKQGDLYYLSDINLSGEDFLCAPYHGWYHDAESNVGIRYGNWCGMIEKQYPTEQEGYEKNLYFKGTDGNDYWIQFIQLTNNTDIEVAQYKKVPGGQWVEVHLQPEKCVEKKENR